MPRLFTVLLCFALTQAAQAWPEKPVRIIVPFAPGGTADTLGRLTAQRFAESFGQPFIVENRPGAGGAIGAELVARAVPDGYTLLVSGVASLAIAPALPRGVTYDPLRDFTHIALFGGPPAVLVVNPAVPAKTLKEFVDLVKKDNRYSYGSPGNGTHGHLVAELFKRAAGIELQHVPYKGGTGAIADLIAGHLPCASITLSTAAGQVHSGRARALAVSTASRLPDYPDLPTYAELGYGELVATIWFSLSGPARLPWQIAERMNSATRKILELPDIREKLRPEGIEPGRMSAREFTAFVAEEVGRWGPIVRASGAKND
jgi:tripartite-type tricarboxylate transporter receptor subunit TctC